ncbi:MAG TPA: GntR family transcriptional regulator [Zoogloea sp.]|uniref:GntR family transcriptional regulator n=1 Tax=Zoogloea sp. TaxID=49181 RepID=UPI002B5B3817|nr:GntR family transcriptional regulator [Zoogloea sp.]HMV19351.1 GntR family transcriptional regulator [Rhodocyclaceae bacterium]HMV65051.1 GntR family transcriptional regulator [Rhodocyclaceae bacterium]HMW53812.1 GntR family transcriptional regulator [Rhodocyclaceae bacterium]HMY50728.1 GntR family transcriptional regulator [Rhodocyclaceae bacterium]HMZ75481.1 GntR family transcriptional regulator [Rhodocyclaceae bacterium]
MNATRIAPLALYQEVAERLRQRIFAHELPPGTWVDEQALAAQYGISRTPLREALKVLASEGLVTLKPRRGCYVTEISERDLDEIFSVMALLEGQCAASTARRAGDGDLVRLHTIHDELEKAAASNDIDGFFEANQAFHQELQRIANNRWLTQAIVDLRKVIKLSRHHSLFIDGRLQQSLLEHRVILAALDRRDEAGAEAAMREHISSARRALARIASTRDEAAA